MSLDEVLKLLFFVPVALRRPTALAIVVLASLAAVLDFKEEFGVWEATQTPPWLGVLTACGALLLAWAIRSRARLTRVALWIWAAIYAATAIGAGILLRSALDEAYNPIGFLASRQWMPDEKQPADARLRRFEWRIRAVKDLSATPVFVELGNADECRFEQFWPTSSAAQYTPTITDVTVDARRSTRWRLQNLRKPAELVFHLDVPRAGDTDADAPPGCTPRITTGTSK